MDVASFIGDIVEIKCGCSENYSGTVVELDPSSQELVLEKATVNGNRLASKVRIKGQDVTDLKIVSHKGNAKVQQQRHQDQQVIFALEENESISKKKEMPAKESKNSIDSSLVKKNRLKKGKKDQLIEGPGYTKPDFDFEKNLALFDKSTVFEELKESISSGLRKGVVRNFKGNENVLESEPVSLRRIQVPLEHVGKEYTTDNGFIVPAVSSELRKRLFVQAERAGLSTVQRVENVGICTCQMALQLVGGERRICPKNAHQAPIIVILAGPHLGGLQAISAARHLANHTVKVILFAPEHSLLLDSQLELFLKTNGSLLRSVQELPSQPVDMVIDALTNHDNNDIKYNWLSCVIEWANHNKAPVLALDPCIRSSKPVDVVIKWSIALALPLIGSSKSGRMYLADVGIPKGVFKEVGISYTSPFGDKFIIPLYD